MSLNAKTQESKQIRVAQNYTKTTKLSELNIEAPFKVLPTTSIYSDLAKYDLSSRLKQELMGSLLPPIILCIGSDRVIGDALGPIVGHLLVKKYNINTYVYGTLESPVNALNVLETYEHIVATHTTRDILVVDAAQSLHGTLGDIRAGRGSIQPASALRKNAFPQMGDYYCLGIVAETSFFSATLLASTRLGIIYRMAEIIAAGIADALCN
ncbi:MAG: spore protease YyaC [Firmicutes bacterium]|nr:spore protease YyaC [Bacillota bacterium]